MLAGVVGDLKVAVGPHFYSGDKEKAIEPVKTKLPPIVNFIKGNFLTGDSPVWLDFFFFEQLEKMAFLTGG